MFKFPDPSVPMLTIKQELARGSSWSLFTPRVTRLCHGTKLSRSSNRHFGPQKTRVLLETIQRVLRSLIWAKPVDKRHGKAIRAASQKRLLSTAVRTRPKSLSLKVGACRLRVSSISNGIGLPHIRLTEAIHCCVLHFLASRFQGAHCRKPKANGSVLRFRILILRNADVYPTRGDQGWASLTPMRSSPRLPVPLARNRANASY
jgi:hypothetical protein